MTDATAKCFARRRYAERDWRACDRDATWLIGTARVPYCDECAADYPKVRGREVERVRLIDGFKPFNKDKS